ncbi:PH-like domain-containing protein [Planctomonas psychrotolerans]|uniref:PH-like domain-containing protein n=1 Tax=Planctomonas psychrotolerans TaxID=2528712 RepID=UPI00123B5CFA|nr:hypothetical protein [Planctomonas psychrotolerans]
MNERVVPGVIVLLLLAGLLTLMYRGWRARQRRQSGISRPPTPPATLGPDLASLDVLYVATTVAAEPLDRIAVHGLGYRGRALVRVTPEGVVLAITGEDEVFIGADAIDGHGLATYTIDRVVESGGLVVITWRLGGPDGILVDSYLRVTDADARPGLLAALERISRTERTSE